ncbi:MAG TPA: hypothetical protein VK821_01095 [Dehalococcoidia bacterium]|nr:hypothetical protein [Dehalococcoidia bacterium]
MSGGSLAHLLGDCLRLRFAAAAEAHREALVAQLRTVRRSWGEPSEKIFRIPIHREAGKHLARGLLEREIDVPCTYQPLHQDGLGHAFVNTVLFLDYDRTRFPYPILPFQVNCCCRRVIAQQGIRGSLAAPVAEGDLTRHPRRLNAACRSAPRPRRSWRTARGARRWSRRRAGRTPS